MNEVLINPDINHGAQKVCDGASEVKDAVVQQSSEALRCAREQTESSIRTYPFHSVLIAAGVGAIIGAFVCHR